MITPPQKKLPTGNINIDDKPIRNSNFELLRLLSMLLILALHANHLSIGEPTIEANPFQIFIRELFQQICDVGVNVFVLISGWFGIRPKRRSFINLFFQVMFYSVLLYILMYVLGSHPSVSQSIKMLWFGSGYWFVPAYIVLYALSPVLNTFVEKSERLSVAKFLFAFFSLELIYGWLFFDTGNFAGGYSPISFIGLYVLARYMRLYQPSITKWSIDKLIFLYIGICIAGAVITMASLISGVSILSEIMPGKMLVYISPFVVVPSVLLVLIFNKIRFQSNIINWLASSCFAIYLIHQHPMVMPYFIKACKNIFDNYSGLSYLCIIILFLLIVALLSILVDKIRMLCWPRIRILF